MGATRSNSSQNNRNDNINNNNSNNSNNSENYRQQRQRQRQYPNRPQGRSNNHTVDSLENGTATTTTRSDPTATSGGGYMRYSGGSDGVGHRTTVTQRPNHHQQQQHHHHHHREERHSRTDRNHPQHHGSTSSTTTSISSQTHYRKRHRGTDDRDYYGANSGPSGNSVKNTHHTRSYDPNSSDSDTESRVTRPPTNGIDRYNHSSGGRTNKYNPMPPPPHRTTAMDRYNAAADDNVNTHSRMERNHHQRRRQSLSPTTIATAVVTASCASTTSSRPQYRHDDTTLDGNRSVSKYNIDNRHHSSFDVPHATSPSTQPSSSHIETLRPSRKYDDNEADLDGSVPTKILLTDGEDDASFDRQWVDSCLRIPRLRHEQFYYRNTNSNSNRINVQELGRGGPSLSWCKHCLHNVYQPFRAT
jgi:hypothetical protein